MCTLKACTFGKLRHATDVDRVLMSLYTCTPRLPWFQWPIIYDIRSRPRKISSPTGSKDLQMVNITLRVLARPDASKLPQIYRVLGTDYDERVLPSICNEVCSHKLFRLLQELMLTPFYL